MVSILRRLLFHDFKLLAKNKRMIPTLILFPIVLILILGKVFDGGSGAKIIKFDVAIQNEDKGLELDSNTILSFGDILTNTAFNVDGVKEMINVKEVRSEVEGQQLVKEGKAAAFIYIPSDYTAKYMNKENADVKFIGNQKQSIDVSVVKEVLASFNEDVKLSTLTKEEIIKESGTSIPKEKLQQIISNLSNNDKVSSSIKTVATSDSKPITSMQYYSIGMIAMFSITTAFILVQYMIDEKLNNTFNRIKSTPISGTQYVFGKLLGIIFAITAQMNILIVITHFLYGMDWGNIWYIELITVSYCFAIGSIVLLGGLIAKDHRAITSIQPAIFYLFSFLGGSMVAKTAFPSSLQILQQIVPNGQALNAYLKVVQAGSFNDITTSIGILVGIGIVFLSISAGVYSGKWRGMTNVATNHQKSEQASL